MSVLSRRAVSAGGLRFISLAASAIGLCGLISIFCIQASRPQPNHYWITILDVGQGLAVVVQTARHLLVYDTGARIPGGFDAGRDVVAPYLDSLGIKRIDTMMISHGDNDHSGGAKTLLSQWPETRILTSVPKMFKEADAKFCVAGLKWEWDGVSFQLLAPQQSSLYQGNNSSCVLQVGGGSQKLLLTGDIEKEAEQELVSLYGVELKSQILIVPHHGSKTSSSPAFLAKVQPQMAIFSAGYFNRFHFPAPSVWARYQAMPTHSFLTSETGAIQIRLTQISAPLISIANTHQFFWQN